MQVLEFLCEVIEELIADLANKNMADPRIEELLEDEATLILEVKP